MQTKAKIKCKKLKELISLQTELINNPIIKEKYKIYVKCYMVYSLIITTINIKFIDLIYWVKDPLQFSI